MEQRERHAAIVSILANNGKRTAEYFAEYFGVSPRTVYRDVAALRVQGTPIIGEPGQGLSLDVDTASTPVSLGLTELMALAEVARLGLSQASVCDPVIAARAIERIEQTLPEGLRPGCW